MTLFCKYKICRCFRKEGWLKRNYWGPCELFSWKMYSGSSSIHFLVRKKWKFNLGNLIHWNFCQNFGYHYVIRRQRMFCQLLFFQRVKGLCCIPLQTFVLLFVTIGSMYTFLNIFFRLHGQYSWSLRTLQEMIVN